VGANLVRLMLERGRQVRVLVHRDTRALEGLDLERVRGDVRNPDDLRRAFQGARVVFHLAAVISITGDQRGRVTSTNVDGARNAASAALDAGVERFVHFSSIHAFDLDDRSGPICETTRRPPASHPAYNRSKAAGEAEVRKVIDRGLDAVIVNPAAVLGPLDFRPSHPGQLFLDLYRGKLPSLIAGGFNWVDVRDLAQTALAAEERGRTGESYLVAGHYHTALELAQWAEEITGVAMPGTEAPQWLARMGAPFMSMANKLLGIRPLYTLESLHALRMNPEVCWEKARVELGHSARPIRETVFDAYRWFAERGLVELGGRASG
jgi:dihydroflavonol-4-reductase